MLKPKQRAFLRKLANSLDPIFQIGKAGVTPELVDAVSAALEARELIKVNVLKNFIVVHKSLPSLFFILFD